MMLTEWRENQIWDLLLISESSKNDKSLFFIPVAGILRTHVPGGR